MMKAQSCHSPTPESDEKEPPMGRLRKQRSMSMEEYDKPLGIYSSSTGKYGSSPPSYSTSPSRTSHLAAHEPKVEVITLIVCVYRINTIHYMCFTHIDCVCVQD